MVKTFDTSSPDYSPENAPDFPLSKAKVAQLRRSLLAWFAANQRDLPWRHTSDPYRIWLSEVMLQQTRVAAVLGYYERFLETCPTVEDLANLSEDNLLRLWSGLGYYSRARNMQAAARLIVAMGGFPTTYPEIRALPGVGDYTAAAVASIAFNLPFAAVDGNVVRVATRLLNIDAEVTTTQTKKRIAEAAQILLDKHHPGQFNQAMMEIGATICTSKRPKCCECPVETLCISRAYGVETQLPIKMRKFVLQHVERTLLVVVRNGDILLWRRNSDASLLQGFWELPEPHQLPNAELGVTLHTFSHAITNTLYKFRLVTARAKYIPKGYAFKKQQELASIPLSTVTRKSLLALESPKVSVATTTR